MDRIVNASSEKQIGVANQKTIIMLVMHKGIQMIYLT